MNILQIRNWIIKPFLWCMCPFYRCLHRPNIILFFVGFVGGSVWIFLGRNGYRVYVNFSTISRQSRSENSNSADEKGIRLQNKHKRVILVGIMTAQKFLDNRALEVWNTWAKQINGKVVFFVGQETKISPEVQESGMPIYKLRGVDDRIYPPQKKSLAMLHWMHVNFIHEFGWFMRADDDLYVRADKLDKLYIGQAGLGNAEEFGKLSLGLNENYCMGGPGVILSRETLRILGPYLSDCLGRIITTHEDVELGRCIHQHVGISCTWNYEMGQLFYNNLSLQRDFDAKIFKGAAFRKAIALHPIKRSELMKRVHHETGLLRLKTLEAERLRLSLELEDVKRKLAISNYLLANETVISMLDRKSNPLLHPQHRGIIEWNHFSNDVAMEYCGTRDNCPIHQTEPSRRVALKEMIEKLLDEFNADAYYRGRLFQFPEVQYGYTRLIDDEDRVDYIIDLALLYKRLRGTKKLAFPVRKHVYLQQHFGPEKVLLEREYRYLIQQGPNSFISPNSPIKIEEILSQKVHIILPLSGRIETFYRFSQNLRLIAHDGDANIHLIVVLFSSKNVTDDQQIISLINENSRYVQTDIITMPSNESVQFSRGLALTAGARVLPRNALLFFVDVDILFDSAVLKRIRLNTILKSQVYFPVVFSEFWPPTWSTFPSDEIYDATHAKYSDFKTYDSKRGYFRSFGYGVVAIYKNDFDAVGGFDLKIEGWGFEDVDLFNRCLNAANLRVFRAIEPGLVHIFHPINCSSLSDPHPPNDSIHKRMQREKQTEMCRGTRAQNLASQHWFAEQLLMPNVLRKF